MEWFLRCMGEAIAAAAWEKVQWYSCRGLVEEYHKAMKTGCQIEDLQLHTELALQPMIAPLSVVAVLLLNLRLACRHLEADQRPAQGLVEPVYEQTPRGRNEKTAVPPGPLSFQVRLKMNLLPPSSRWESAG